MRILQDNHDLRDLKKTLESLNPSPSPSPKKGGFPDLASELPRTQNISGVYDMTPYVTEPRESAGEYLGCRWSPSPKFVNRTKKQYSLQ